MNLEEDIEPYLEHRICLKYWDIRTDHENFRRIINAIYLGGGQTCNVVGVLQELDKVGFIIKRRE